jgi:hypothetical protein
MKARERVEARAEALAHAAMRPPGEALEAWRRWRTSGLDPRRDPVALRWLPLIGWNLQHTNLDAASRALFRDALQGMWASNVRLLDAAAPVLDALAAAGVRVMLLKGAALALTVYETPGLRPIGDVDLLVDPDQASAAVDLLAAHRWRPLRPVNRRDLLLCHGVNFESSPFGACDMHWYLLAECCWPGVDAGVWRRARPIQTPTFDGLVPSPADQLLHVCLHGLRWSPVPSRHWMADAARIMAHAGSDLHWDDLVEEATRRRLALQMAVALRSVQDAAAVSVPSEVLNAFDAQPASWRDRLELRAKRRPVASPSGLFLISCSRARLARERLGSPPGRLRYLAATVGVTSRRALLPWALRHARRWWWNRLRRRSRRNVDRATGPAS